MAASFNESQKIDYLWKKVGYGVTKTAEPASKEAFNVQDTVPQYNVQKISQHQTIKPGKQTQPTGFPHSLVTIILCRCMQPHPALPMLKQWVPSCLVQVLVQMTPGSLTISPVY